MILFLLMNCIAGLTAFWLIDRVFRFEDQADRALACFTAYLAQIAATEMLLGICGRLSLSNLLLLNLVLFLAAGFFLRRRKPAFRPDGPAAFALPVDKAALFCISLILGFGIVKVAANLSNPPFGWDCLNYHFTFAVEWLKSGFLDNPIVVSDDPFPTYYPVNGSLWFLWLIYPFRSAFIADLGQLPFFVISLLAVYSICRKLKISSEFSLFAACLFGFIPNFFKQLQIAYVDIIVCGLFLTALNFLLGLKEKFSIANLIFFSAAFGLCLGTKTTVLSYAVFLSIAYLYIALSRKDATLTGKVSIIFACAMLALLFGGFSYLRNFFLTGNPLYPLQLSLFGKTIFKGVIDSATHSSRNDPGAFSLAKLLFSEGAGAQTLLVILPAAFLALPLNIFKNRRRDFFSNYLLLLPLMLYLAFRFTIPLPNARYLYPALGAGMVTGFYCLSSLKIPLKAVRWLTLILMIAASFECSRRTELIISWVLSLAVWGMSMPIFKRRALLRNIFSKKIIIPLGAAALVALQFLFLDYRKNEYMRYILNSRYWPEATAAWAWLNDHTKGDNVAYAGRPAPYPLYGTDLKNNVFYTSVNRIEPVQLHYLKDSRYRWHDAEGMHRSFEEPGNYRGNADYAVWLNNLAGRKADFLFVYSLHHTREVAFPIEEKWARSHPDKFNLVFNNETIRIYKLMP